MRHTAMLTLGLLVAVAGCDLFDNALGVQTPSSIPAGSLETPSHATLLVNGAIADFECAAGAYAMMSGLITDELVDATQTADRFPYEIRRMVSSDRRYAVNHCEDLGVYAPLQTARFSALNALSLLQGWTNKQVPGRDTLIAELQAYEGYSLVLLGEGFCTMVVSTLDASRQTVYGGEIQRDSVFKLAMEVFTAAIDGATATGNSGILNMALVGRARAYTNLGQLAAAATDAQLVPATYLKKVAASAINSRRNNRVWQENNALNGSTSLDSPYVAMNDPRVPFVNRGDSSVTKIPLYTQLKYTASSDSTRLASGDEARLIRAEADIRLSGVANPTVADSIINRFRARSNNQGPMVSTSQQMALDSLFDQRRREFFLEGQHLGAVIRFGIMPYPAPNTDYKGGGKYGTQLCLPLPDVEKQNNPNFP